MGGAHISPAWRVSQRTAAMIYTGAEGGEGGGKGGGRVKVSGVAGGRGAWWGGGGGDEKWNYICILVRYETMRPGPLQ